MKTEILFLVFGIILCPVLTFDVDEGCEVRSDLKIDYRWPDVAFSVWVPHLEISKPIITIETHFKGHDHPITYDKIILYSNRIQLNKKRDENFTSVLNQTIDMIDNGWADFTLKVDSHYGLKFLGKAILPLNISVDYMPKFLLITGSNITLNCPSKMRTWDIADSYVSVPLDGSKEYVLSFFSTSNFSLSVSLEGKESKLRWNNGTVTTILSKSHPLPPFVQHHLKLTCQKHENTICTMKFGKGIKNEEIITLADIPQSISVKGNPGDDFFVSLYEPLSMSEWRFVADFLSCLLNRTTPALVTDQS